MHDSPVSLAAFVAAMESHWTGRLANISSPALRATWRQLGDGLNAHASGATNDWTVLQPATGTGKSQGVALYAAMLSELSGADHPGVLLVKRLTAEADAAAALINELGERPTAIAHHSKSGTDIDSLSDYPVIVITQRAFLLAIDNAASVPDAWRRLTHWEGGERKLIVIDEALDIVDEAELTLEWLAHTAAAVRSLARGETAKDVATLTGVVSLLEARLTETDGQRSVLTCEEFLNALGLAEPPRFEALLGELSSLEFELLEGDARDLERRETLRRRHQARIKRLVRQLADWALLSQQGQRCRLSHARSMIPESARGAVVLDATADCSCVYQVRGIYPVPAPVGARDYREVTVHASRGHRVGKGYLADHAVEEAQRLVDALAQELTPDRKVLFCCHKDVEPVLRACLAGAPFESCVGRWGAIDGSNDWQACDAVVVFGLPYPPTTRAANVFSALQGPQSTEWFQADERPFGEHSDILRALRDDHVVASVVQAIGRVRCRRVVDAEGRCLSTDVYLLLPGKGSALADAILSGIQRSMPGVRLAKWNGAAADKPPRKRNRDGYLPSIAAYVGSLGEAVERRKVQQALDIPQRTMRRIWDDLKRQSDEALREVGVLVEEVGNRRLFRPA